MAKPLGFGPLASFVRPLLGAPLIFQATALVLGLHGTPDARCRNDPEEGIDTRYVIARLIVAGSGKVAMFGAPPTSIRDRHGHAFWTRGHDRAAFGGTVLDRGTGFITSGRSPASRKLCRLEPHAVLDVLGGLEPDGLPSLVKELTAALGTKALKAFRQVVGGAGSAQLKALSDLPGDRCILGIAEVSARVDHVGQRVIR